MSIKEIGAMTYEQNEEEETKEKVKHIVTWEDKRALKGYKKCSPSDEKTVPRRGFKRSLGTDCIEKVLGVDELPTEKSKSFYDSLPTFSPLPKPSI